MATRSKKSSTPRGSEPGRERKHSAPVEGTNTARDVGPERPPGGRTFDGVADAFDSGFLFGHPLGRLTTLFLIQLLEWQSTALEFYQRALREGVFDAPSEQHLRKMVRTMMSAYLDLAKSAPERRERLQVEQTELAQALSEVLEDLRRRLRQSSS
jgi:hypothetical protein